MDLKAIGEYLKRLRRRADYTQSDLGSLINVTDKAISRWESGAGIPEVSNLVELAQIFGVTVDDILNCNEAVFDAQPQPAKTDIQKDPEPEVSQAEIKTSAKVNSNRGFGLILLLAYLVLGTYTLSETASYIPRGYSYTSTTFVIIFSVLILSGAVVRFVSNYKPRKACNILILVVDSLMILCALILMSVVAGCSIGEEGAEAVVISCASFVLLFTIQLLYSLTGVISIDKANKILKIIAVCLASLILILGIVSCIICEVDFVGESYNYITLATVFTGVFTLSFTLSKLLSKWINIVTASLFLPYSILSIAIQVFSNESIFALFETSYFQDTSIGDFGGLFIANCSIGIAVLGCAQIAISWFFEGKKSHLKVVRITYTIAAVLLIPFIIYTFDILALNIIVGYRSEAAAVFIRLPIFVAMILNLIKEYRFDLIFKPSGKGRKAQ